MNMEQGHDTQRNVLWGQAIGVYDVLGADNQVSVAKWHTFGAAGGAARVQY